MWWRWVAQTEVYILISALAYFKAVFLTVLEILNEGTWLDFVASGLSQVKAMYTIFGPGAQT